MTTAPVDGRDLRPEPYGGDQKAPNAVSLVAPLRDVSHELRTAIGLLNETIGQIDL